MNRKVAIALSVATLITIASPVFALENTVGANATVKSEVRANIQAEREEVREQVEENRAEVKAKVEANRAEVKEVRAENKAEVKEMRTENKAELEAKRDALKGDVKAKRMDLVKKFGTQMIKVHTAAVERLETLADRISSRITKIEADKKSDLSGAKAKLADAKVKITTAATFVAGLQVKIDAAVAAGTDPKATLETVRGYFETSRENLKSAHAALVDVISSLKPGTQSATSTATTTP